MDLPLAPIERLLKRTNMRVSKDAILEFENLLEEIIADIAADAVAEAKRDKKSTVSAEHVRKVVSKLR